MCSYVEHLECIVRNPGMIEIFQDHLNEYLIGVLFLFRLAIHQVLCSLHSHVAISQPTVLILFWTSKDVFCMNDSFDSYVVSFSMNRDYNGGKILPARIRSQAIMYPVEVSISSKNPTSRHRATSNSLSKSNVTIMKWRWPHPC